LWHSEEHSLKKRWAIIALVATGVVSAGYFLKGNLRLGLLPPSAANVVYGVTSPAQRLDIYFPPGAGPFRVVVYIHGGAFKVGDKRKPFDGFVNAIELLNAHGIALASTNYRMSGEARYPAAVADSRSAMRYLRANAAQYHLDPHRIAVWGKSAGANLALMVGVGDRSPQFDDPVIAPTASSRVVAVVSMYPPTDFSQMDDELRASPCSANVADHSAADSPESLFMGTQVTAIPDKVRAASPVTYLRTDTPPMMLQAGSADCTVSHDQTLLMASALKAAHLNYSAALLPGAQHADDAFQTPKNQRRVLAFLEHAFAEP
jgi:acetyl esterase/lipase